MGRRWKRITLDVRRALRKEPLAVDAFFSELETVRGQDSAFDGLFIELERLIRHDP